MRTFFFGLMFFAFSVGTPAEARDKAPATLQASFDPYNASAVPTVDRLQGFRSLYVAPEFADGMKPTKSVESVLSLPRTGDLAITNPTSAWVDVAVNGAKIGRIGPFHEATIHDVASGVYELAFTLPDGQKVTRQTPTALPAPAPANEG